MPKPTTTTDLRPATLESFKTAVECIRANGGSTSLERVPSTLVKKGLLVQVKAGGRGNRKSRFALTPAGITLALSLASSACTTIIVQAPDDEGGSTIAVSFGESWPMPADASSSTSGDLDEDQTTGERGESSTSGGTDDDDASTSTTEKGTDSTTEETEASTGADDSTSVDTTGDAPAEDKMCSTIACSFDAAANDCQLQGHPGMCLVEGGETLCCGSLPSTTYFFDLAPEVPEFGKWSTSGLISLKTWTQHLLLVPASPTPIYLETNSVDYGQLRVIVMGPEGGVLQDISTDVDHFELEAGSAHWLMLRALNDKTHYSLLLSRN